MRTYLLTLAIALLPCTTEAIVGEGGTRLDEEMARQSAHHFEERYWECLAKEAVRVLPKKFSRQNFVLFAEGACPTEAQQFRVAMIDYLAIRFPQMAMSDYITAANQAVSAAVDDIVKAYVETKQLGSQNTLATPEAP